MDCVDPLAATCDASVSLSCLSGYLYQGTCYSQCPSGTYASGARSRVLPCLRMQRLPACCLSARLYLHVVR